jgi:NAD(P)-dependent dehydrogenase (short-subunit alcohol dehydrogenase family)
LHPQQPVQAITAEAVLAQFSRFPAQETGPPGITVNVAEPGTVAETRISRVLSESKSSARFAIYPDIQPLRINIGHLRLWPRQSLTDVTNVPPVPRPG